MEFLELIFSVEFLEDESKVVECILKNGKYYCEQDIEKKVD